MKVYRFFNNQITQNFGIGYASLLIFSILFSGTWTRLAMGCEMRFAESQP
jgi:hypothetical protein